MSLRYHKEYQSYVGFPIFWHQAISMQMRSNGVESITARAVNQTRKVNGLTGKWCLKNQRQTVIGVWDAKVQLECGMRSIFFELLELFVQSKVEYMFVDTMKNSPVSGM